MFKIAKDRIELNPHVIVIRVFEVALVTCVIGLGWRGATATGEHVIGPNGFGAIGTLTVLDGDFESDLLGLEMSLRYDVFRLLISCPANVHNQHGLVGELACLDILFICRWVDVDIVKIAYSGSLVAIALPRRRRHCGIVTESEVGADENPGTMTSRALELAVLGVLGR